MNPSDGCAVVDLDDVDAALFDLDGVITDTASVHEEAWKCLFDDFLGQRADSSSENVEPFTHEDYTRLVDGKPRLDGIRAFLDERGIRLPDGEPDDRGNDTVHGLAARKDRYFHDRLADRGVTVFDTSVDLVRMLKRAGVSTGVFSASRNCAAVLEAAGLEDLFDIRVDGEVAAELDLPGKPDPATLLEAAQRLDTDPNRAMVVEDARVGVEAGCRGGFGLVIGVDRAGDGDDLGFHGADVVVADLGDVEVLQGRRRRLSDVPHALASFDRLIGMLLRQRVAVFLDFDGTLSPIVDDPDAAAPVEGARSALEALADRCPVAVVSGRDLRDVRRRVGVEGIWYAGSHGFELAGPSGEEHEHEPATAALEPLDEAEEALRRQLGGIDGAVVERKRFSLSAHYRQVAEGEAQEVVRAVEDVASDHDELIATGGRRVAELRPDLDWNKGRALDWLSERIGSDRHTAPLYAGDDLTDEDALEAVRDTGFGIVVRSADHGDRPTAAHAAVDGPDELCELLERIGEVLAAQQTTKELR